MVICLHSANLVTYWRKTYVKNICEQRFTWLDSLSHHMRIHTGEKAHMLNICNKNFSNKAQYIRGIILISVGSGMWCTFYPVILYETATKNTQWRKTHTHVVYVTKDLLHLTTCTDLQLYTLIEKVVIFSAFIEFLARFTAETKNYN